MHILALIGAIALTITLVSAFCGIVALLVIGWGRYHQKAFTEGVEDTSDHRERLQEGIVLEVLSHNGRYWAYVESGWPLAQRSYPTVSLAIDIEQLKVGVVVRVDLRMRRIIQIVGGEEPFEASV